MVLKKVLMRRVAHVEGVKCEEHGDGEHGKRGERPASRAMHRTEASGLPACLPACCRVRAAHTQERAAHGERGRWWRARSGEGCDFEERGRGGLGEGGASIEPRNGGVFKSVSPKPETRQRTEFCHYEHTNKLSYVIQN